MKAILVSISSLCIFVLQGVLSTEIKVYEANGLAKLTHGPCEHGPWGHEHYGRGPYGRGHY